MFLSSGQEGLGQPHLRNHPHRSNGLPLQHSLKVLYGLQVLSHYLKSSDEITEWRQDFLLADNIRPTQYNYFHRKGKQKKPLGETVTPCFRGQWGRQGGVKNKVNSLWTSRWQTVKYCWHISMSGILMAGNQTHFSKLPRILKLSYAIELSSWKHGCKGNNHILSHSSLHIYVTAGYILESTIVNRTTVWGVIYNMGSVGVCSRTPICNKQ